MAASLECFLEIDMKRVVKLLMFLLIAAGLYYFYINNQSTVTGWLMLFNQNSTQVLHGRISKAESPVLTAISLSAFQAIAMPWKSNPRIAVACSAVFGLVPGMLICLAGRVIAALVWYVLGWLLLGFKSEKFKKLSLPMALVYGGICCFAPSWTAPIALLCGIMSVPLLLSLSAAILVQIPAMGFYAKFANVYSSIIPKWCGPFMYALGAALIIAAVVLIVVKKRK